MMDAKRPTPAIPYHTTIPYTGDEEAHSSSKVGVGVSALSLNNWRWVADAATDGDSRLNRIEDFLSDGGLVDATEIKFISAAKSILSKWDNNEMASTKVKVKSSLFTSSILQLKTSTAPTTLDTIDHHAVLGTATGLVRGASIDDLLAYSMDLESMFFSKHEYDSKRTISEKILENINSHHAVLYYKGSLPTPFFDRDFVWSAVWQKQTSKQCICVFHPAHHKEAPPPKSDTVRAESTRVFRFTEVKPGVTKLELIFRYVARTRHTTCHTF